MSLWWREVPPQTDGHILFAPVRIVTSSWGMCTHVSLHKLEGRGGERQPQRRRGVGVGVGGGGEEGMDGVSGWRGGEVGVASCLWHYLAASSRPTTRLSLSLNREMMDYCRI